MDEGKLSEKIIWSGLVTDNEDPLMLNRVRVSFDSSVDGQSNQSILDSIPEVIDGKKTKTSDNTDLTDEFKWSKIDPFCFLPLLPLFLKVTPKIGEAVNLIYPNPMFKKNEQYYVQGSFTSPTTIFRQDFEASRMFATKDRIINANNLKKPGTTEFFNPDTDGVFPDTEDSALLGRGTCDIIVKERDVLIRAGKSSEYPDSPTKKISVRKNRSFIQLSDFGSRIDDLGNRTLFRAVLESAYVKKLIEWDIINPENQYDKFILRINVYRLKEKIKYTTKNFTINTEVDPVDTTLFISMQWDNLSASAGTVSNTVNDFIKQFNDGVINMPGFPIRTVSDNFPFIFRPGPATYSFIKNMSPTQQVQFLNITKIKSDIIFKSEKDGYGLVFSKDRTGQQGFIQTEILKQLSYTDNPTTYNLHGADRIYLISHDSQIPGLKKIDLDKKTVKKIPQDFIIDEILPNTNSSVRGEELLKLLNMIVQFLVGHTHQWHQIPPVEQAGNITKNMLTTSISNSENTILNKNIRIN